jgi:hypothetical protein
MGTINSSVDTPTTSVNITQPEQLNTTEVDTETLAETTPEPTETEAKPSLQETGQRAIDEAERARQQWGTSFDLKNTLNDWAAYINIYLSKATAMGASKEEVNSGLRKAAGIAISALYHAENGLLVPRHYDGQERPESLPEIEG